MKIAYLAPELPALSATFVYNDIRELERLGTTVVPFSVHFPLGQFDEPEVKLIKQKVTTLYGTKKRDLLRSHWRLMTRQCRCYFSTVGMLLSDMCCLGFKRQTMGLAYRFVFAGMLADELQKHQCQHLHVHFAHIPTDIAMYATKLAGIGFSVTSHANDLFERGWLLQQKIERATFFGTISEFNRHYLSDIGANEDKIEIVRCGVDPKQFVTRQWKKPSNPIKIGVVGRLVEKKGIDVLIKSIALLKQQGEDVSLAIVGSGPLMADMETLIQQLKLDDDVMMMGALPHTAVSRFIQSLDIFVLPCKQDKHGDMDGIPVVLMEAMMSGVPVISTQISGIPELVVDGETGLCILPDDETALSGAIVQLIQNEDDAKEMTKKAVEHVTKYFSLSSNVQKLNSLFQHEVE